MDATDIQILNILQENGRITSKELANQIGLSEGPTGKRLSNLLKRGIISKMVALINHHAFGYNYQALLLFKVVKGKSRRAISKLEEKLNVLLVFEIRKQEILNSPNPHLFAWVICKSRRHFVDSIQELLQNDNLVLSFDYFEVVSKIYDNPFVCLTVEDQL